MHKTSHYNRLNQQGFQGRVREYARRAAVRALECRLQYVKGDVVNKGGYRGGFIGLGGLYHYASTRVFFPYDFE